MPRASREKKFLRFRVTVEAEGVPSSMTRDSVRVVESEEVDEGWRNVIGELEDSQKVALAALLVKSVPFSRFKRYSVNGGEASTFVHAGNRLKRWPVDIIKSMIVLEGQAAGS